MNIRIGVTTGLLLTALASYGQDYSGDVFRYSEQLISGTARFQGLGGNHTALGGDASNAWGNPAGLGFYNRSELSISPSVRLLNSSAGYLGQTSNTSKSFPFVGSASVIFAGMPNGRESRGPSRTVWGVSYSRQVSLGNEFSAQGQNNRSSVVDSYIENANGTTGANLNQQYDKQANIAYPKAYSDGYIDGLTAAAYQHYLINPNSPPLDTLTYFRYDNTVPVSQRASYSSTGAVSQWGISVASNFNDKFYIGGTLALSHTRYNYTSIISEQYVGGRVFRGLRENTDYSVTGNGINLSVGAIYKVDQNVQLGLTVQSPTWTTRAYQETTNQSLTIDPIGIPLVDNGRPVLFIPDVKTIPVAPSDFDFSVSTPLRLSGGVTYFLGKSGFLTATAEYVNYAGMRAGTSYYQNASDNQTFKQDQTSYVKSIYQNTFNFRLGGEFRSGIFRARIGGAYLPTAYKSTFDPLARNGDRNVILYSAGLGVRNTKFFADLAGVYYTTKTSYTPYYLSNTSDYASALLTNKNANLTLSVGAFF